MNALFPKKRKHTREKRKCTDTRMPLPKPLRRAIRLSGIALCIVVLVYFLAIPGVKYAYACQLRESDPLAAAQQFTQLGYFPGARSQADDIYYAAGVDALRQCDYDAALRYYPHMQTTGGIAQYQAALYTSAATLANAGDYIHAAALFAAISDYQDSAGLYQDACYRAGANLLSRQVYAQAYAYFSDAGDYLDAKQQMQSCRQQCYDALVQTFHETLLVPDDFEQDFLKGYRDTEKYIQYGYLQKTPWTADNSAAHIALAYELGDFEQAAAHGFAFSRLGGHSWSGGGYYFSMDMLSNLDSNLPQYRLSGYYGLYAKIVNGIYYIGSDEKQSWTEQFRLTFSDYDNTLTVYCYSSGETFTLYKTA